MQFDLCNRLCDEIMDIAYKSVMQIINYAIFYIDLFRKMANGAQQKHQDNMSVQ